MSEDATDKVAPVAHEPVEQEGEGKALDGLKSVVRDCLTVNDS
jgi:hypothetical protein